MIFDSIPRTDARPKLSRESEFVFTNRSSRGEIENVRQLLNRLLREYPEASQAEIIARMRCGSDDSYNSACFELLLYSLLVRSGYLLEPHPSLPNGQTKKPDFLVTAPSGKKFYLEAVNSSDSNEDISGSLLTANLLDTLSTHSHSNFLIGVRTRGTPTTQPSGKNYIRQLLSWLNGLDPDEVERAQSEFGYQALPVNNWMHEGLSVESTAIPLANEHRGKATRLLGVRSGGAGWVDAKGVIRDAIRSKGSRYGKLDAPFLIAVNFFGFGLHRVDEVQALFGDQKIVVSLDPAGGEDHVSRDYNGAWMGRGGPEFTRVSGAWIFDELSPYRVTRTRGNLYFNPYAAHELPPDLKAFTHATVEDGRLVSGDGPTFGYLLALPEHWPEC